MDNNIFIRLAIIDDLKSIQALLNHNILNTTAVYDYDVRTDEVMLQWWSQKQAMNLPVLVAVENDKVLGFASYGQYRPFQGFHQSMEHSIYLSESSQGKGIGGQLLENLEEIAKKRNVHVLIAGIDANNTGSIKFHEKRGFEKVGHLKEVGWKFDHYLDLVFLQKVMPAE
jgi:L-amino acid N-acyltransferase YncA